MLRKLKIEKKKNSVQEAMCHAETGIIYTPIEMISILIMGGGGANCLQSSTQHLFRIRIIAFSAL